MDILDKYLREDPDYLYRVMAFNFTLSFEQVLQVLKQADGKHEIGHLVSRQYLMQAQIDVADCQKFLIPLRGEDRPIALYNLPNGREGDLLTYQEIVKSVGEAEELVDRLYERFQKRTGMQIITTTVKNEHGDAVFQMGSQVAILPDASIEEIVEKLLDLGIQKISETQEMPLVGALAAKLLSIYKGKFEILDLSALDALEEEEQLERLDDAFDLYKEVISWIYLALNLDFVIALKKAYAPDLDVEGLQRCLIQIDKRIARRFSSMGEQKEQLVKILKNRCMFYSPPVRL